MAETFYSKEKMYLIRNGKLILVFPEIEDDSDYIKSKLNSPKNVFQPCFFNTFYFERKDMIKLEDYQGYAAFVIGEIKDGYIKLDKRIFHSSSNIYFDANINFNSSINYFYIYPNISLIKVLSKYSCGQDVYIDNEDKNLKGHFSKQIFKLFKKSIPKDKEIQAYKYNQIDKVLHSYFNDITDYDSIFRDIVDSRIKFNPKVFLNQQIKSFETAGLIDVERNIFVSKELNKLLEEDTSEKEWQRKLMPYIRLLYPQYIYVVDEIGFMDLRSKSRRLDYLLVDFDGNVDILELKLPSMELIQKHMYRDNFCESRELSGSIMQCEKYLYNLTSAKKQSEQILRARIKERYHVDIDIHISRPKAIIIAGRTKEFDSLQREDFRIIQRKYINIADIVSYDDLINRLDRAIESVKTQSEHEMPI